MTNDTWNPAQYDKFRQEREQPGLDLIALVRPSPGMRIVDLGCGTGALTRLLHTRLQAAQTLGIDRSARMLKQAASQSGARGLRFELGTIETFGGAGHDLIFSNAAFHWVDDHPALIARLAAALGPSGQLAFQVPAMHEEASHTVADDIAGTSPFREALAGWRRSQPVLRPEQYAHLLYGTGFAAQHVAMAVYPHVLGSREDVIEWMRGTLLTEYERRMPPDLFVRFVAEYRGHLLDRMGDARPFFFPFKRILCWAAKAALTPSSSSLSPAAPR